jgi:hypothetical protein
MNARSIGILSVLLASLLWALEPERGREILLELENLDAR